MRFFSMKLWVLVAGFAFVSVSACSSLYYNFWETLGKQKRDLLQDNVADARDDQKAVQQDFKDALTHLKEAYGSDGSTLEQSYGVIKKDYESAKDQADQLHKRIDKVETIAMDLFVEWKGEADSITNAGYRADSLSKLAATKKSFGVMLAAMRQSELRIQPVMVRLRDQELYMKHNLNAQALGTLRGEAGHIEAEITKLVKDMERSIAASDAFVKTLEPKSGAVPST